jgi:hypothetical protein
MTLLVLGAPDANVRQIAAAASARRLHVASGWSSTRPAWVLVASAADRREALTRYGLPAFRVIEYPGLAGTIDPGVLAAGLARMAEIGDDVPVLSPRAVALTRRLLPLIATRLERLLGGDVPDQEGTVSKKAARTAEKARQKAAVLAERASSADTEGEARRRAERKASRKVARRAEKPSVIDEPRGPRTA